MAQPSRRRRTCQSAPGDNFLTTNTTTISVNVVVVDDLNIADARVGEYRERRLREGRELGGRAAVREEERGAVGRVVGDGVDGDEGWGVGGCGEEEVEWHDICGLGFGGFGGVEGTLGTLGLVGL